MEQSQKTKKCKSRKFCSVPQCSSYCTDTISLHKFPLWNPKLCKRWGTLLKIGKPITKNMYVCSEHFLPEDFTTLNKCLTKGSSTGTFRDRIKKIAIPSVNLPKSSHETPKRNRRILVKVDQTVKPVGKDSSTLTKPIEQLEYQSESTVDEMEVETIIESQLGNDVNIRTEEGSKTESQPVRNEELKSKQTFQDIFQLPQILNTNEKLKVFTGLDFTILGAYKKCVENTASAKNMNPVNIEFSIMLVLCKLKTNLSFSCLSILFGISLSTCTRMFYAMVNLLAVSIKPVIYWPTKEEIVENLPKCFDTFKNTRVVLDCTEVRLQKLKCLNCKILSYSHYKRNHTAKFLIGITPSGLISFVSKAYGGRATDKAIFNKENLIVRFQPNDGIMVDKGVLIDKECEENFLKLIRPPFLRKKKQLSKEDARLTAKIARARVHVERAIEKLKNFAILKNQIDWYLIPYIDDIMTIIAATANMKPPILGDDKF